MIIYTYQFPLFRIVDTSPKHHIYPLGIQWQMASACAIPPLWLDGAFQLSKGYQVLPRTRDA